MITELTKAQEEILENIKNKWIKIGLDTTQLDPNEIKQICRNLHKRLFDTEETRPIIVLSSPWSCWKAVNWIVNNPDKNPEDVLKVDLKDVKTTIDFVWPYIDGSFFVGYFSWVDSMEQIGVKNLPEWKIWAETTKMGLYYPLDTAVVVGQKPSEIHLNDRGQLHHTSKMALKYSDGWGIWALNGVRMKKEHVVTPEEDISPNMVLGETNVEVRRELIRKIGVDRLIDCLPHKLLDKKDNYELYSLELSPEVPDARFLKMINPSIGVYHVEGVGPECSTVQQAINWRSNSLKLNGDWNPEVLT
jgi:hypothetical protein